MALRLPILTSIYHEVYPVKKRGRLTSVSLMSQQVSTASFFYGSGILLDYDFNHSKWILLVWGIAAFVSSLISIRFPVKSKIEIKYNVRQIFLLPFKGKWFGYILMIWFIFGFANLWIYPLRVKYVVAELDLLPSTIAFVLGTLPELTRDL